MHSNDTTTYIYIDNPKDMIDPFHSNQDFMTIVLTHAITFIVGVIGNSVVIATWARGGKIRSPTATFLVSLACADLLLLIIFMPLETLEYFVITWDRHGHICKLSSFVELLSGMSSILNLVAVSVERFLVIVYPIRARRWCTVTKSRRSLFFVWLLAVFFAAPPVFNKSTYSMTYYNNETSITAYYCFEKDDNWAIYFAVYELMTLFVIPAMLMIFCYFRVIRELWTSTRVITILTSSTNAYNSSAIRLQKEPNRSYLVRWPTKKLVSISVNCEPSTVSSSSTSRSSGESKSATTTTTATAASGGRLGKHRQHARRSHQHHHRRPHHHSRSKNAHQNCPHHRHCRRTNQAPPPSPNVSFFQLEDSISMTKAESATAATPTSSISNDSADDYDAHHHQYSNVAPGAHSKRSSLFKIFYFLRNIRWLCGHRPLLCCVVASTAIPTATTTTTNTNCITRHKTCQSQGLYHHRCHHHHHAHSRHNLSGSKSSTSLRTTSICTNQIRSNLTVTHTNCSCSGGSGGGLVDSEPNSGQTKPTLSHTKVPVSLCDSVEVIKCKPTVWWQKGLPCCRSGRWWWRSARSCDADPTTTITAAHKRDQLSQYELQNSTMLNTPGGTTTTTTTLTGPTSYHQYLDGSNYRMTTSSFTTLNSANNGQKDPILATSNDMLHSGHSLSHQNLHPLVTGESNSTCSTSMHLPLPYTRPPVTNVRNARRQLYCQVIKMLLFIVILFHICWGPRLIFNVIKSAGLGYFNNIAYSARVYFYLLSFIHSALNPFVYGFMSSNFRRMMLNSCNHHHHHHHHNRHSQANAGTTHTVTNNSLAEVMATTSCLNMARLKASFSGATEPATNANSRRHSTITNSDLYVDTSSMMMMQHPASSTPTKQQQQQPQLSLLNQCEPMSTSANCRPHTSDTVRPSNQATIEEGRMENKDPFPVSVVVESDPETSYSQIENEIQQIVDSMQRTQRGYPPTAVQSSPTPPPVTGAGAVASMSGGINCKARKQLKRFWQNQSKRLKRSRSMLTMRTKIGHNNNTLHHHHHHNHRNKRNWNKCSESNNDKSQGRSNCSITTVSSSMSKCSSCGGVAYHHSNECEHSF